MGSQTFRPYLYCHHCDLFTDLEALKSLLSTPQPSGKLARWGMAIQDLDVTILHRLGKQNSNADALSHYPLPESGTPSGVPDQTSATIAPLLIEQIVSRHGVPAEVLSDRGKSFRSELVKELPQGKYLSIPSSDGLIG